MDNLSQGLTKAIGEYLDQTEKRQTTQQAAQETHEKLIDSLQAGLKALTVRCDDLTKENISLKEELKNREKREERIDKDISETKSNLEKLQNRLGEYEGWTKLIEAIAGQIKCLNEFRDSAYERFKEIDDNQTEFAKQIRRQQAATITHRVPSKSPSASSYLNNNTHSSLPRLKPTVFHKNNLLLDSQNAEDDISELSDHAEILKRGLDDLTNSFYSDD